MENLEYKSPYLDKILDFTKEEVVTEIKSLCIDLGFDPHNYTLGIETGGIGYVLEKIASSIYMSRKQIHEKIRQKLLLVYLAEETIGSFSNIFSINDSLKNMKKDSYQKERGLALKKETSAKILEAVVLAFKNCQTCADSPNGCRGEDENCNSPGYIDWRPPLNSINLFTI